MSSKVGAEASASSDGFVDLSPGNGNALRPLTLSADDVEFSFAVPCQPFEAWVAADVVREEFQRSVAGTKSAEAVVDDEDEVKGVEELSEAKMVLAAKFLGFLASRPSCRSSTYELSLLQHAWTSFNSEFLGKDKSIHETVAPLDSEDRSATLRAFFEAFTLLEGPSAASPSLTVPKLFQLSAAGTAELHAIFGGQGNNEVSDFRLS